jgi:hypothetical protein
MAVQDQPIERLGGNSRIGDWLKGQTQDGSPCCYGWTDGQPLDESERTLEHLVEDVVGIVGLMRGEHALAVQQVARDLLTEQNAAFQFVEIAFADPIFFDQSGMREPFDFRKKGVEIKVYQRRAAQFEIRFRRGFDIQQTGLTEHLEEGSLPFAFVGNSAFLSFGEDFNCERADLDYTHEAAEVEATVAYGEELATVPLVVANQGFEMM